VSKELYVGFPAVTKEEEDRLEIPIGFSLVFDKSRFESEPTESNEDEKLLDRNDRTEEGFERVQQDYFEQMLAFIDIMPVSHVAVSIGKSLLVSNLKTEVKKYAKSGPERIGSWEVHEFHNELYSTINKSVTKAKRQIESLWVFPNIFLMGLVSQYDAYFGSLIRQLSSVKPHIILDSKRQFSAHEVFSYTDVDTFRSAVLEKEIDAVLRSSHEDQFEWLENKSKVALTKDLAVWPRFIEICERRNLFAHANGVVSEQYLLKCRSVEYEIDYKLGDQLKADANYLYEAAKVFLEIGVKLCQVLWRTSDKSDEAQRLANKSLGDIGYELIYHEQYDLAISLLEFGFSNPMRHPDSTNKSMMLVNLANAYKLSGDQQKANELLDTVDWGPYKIHFQLCVAAVRSDLEVVAELVPSVPEDEIRPQDFFDWPVFRPLKSEASFLEALKKGYGEAKIDGLSFEQTTVKEQSVKQV